MSALQRALLAVFGLAAWQMLAVPKLLEGWSEARAGAPAAAPTSGDDSARDHNWTGPLGHLLSPEVRTHGRELALALPAAEPIPGAALAAEPELLALAGVLLERVGFDGEAAKLPEAPADGGDPWHGVEPRERLRLLRALVLNGELDVPTERAILAAIVAHMEREQAASAVR